jgi:Na+-translocating ferredoxin:NAD+ oxidoreductase RnfE subunit
LVVGGATGALAGVVAMMFPPSGLAMGLGVILAMSLIGAIVGIWASGMITADIPNTHLRKFSRDIEQGKILLMVMCPRTTSRKSAA